MRCANLKRVMTFMESFVAETAASWFESPSKIDSVKYPMGGRSILSLYHARLLSVVQAIRQYLKSRRASAKAPAPA